MMIEHLNLVVADTERSLHFYQTAFPHWRIRYEGHGDWYGKPRRWVHIGDDWQYLAISNHGEGENRDPSGHQVGLAHFAFVIDNLDTIIERLTITGYSIHSPGAQATHRRNVYFLDPDGFEVEFVQYLSDTPAEQNLKE